MLKQMTLILLALSLSACELHKVTDKTELCNQAKRQEIYNANTPTYSSHYLMPNQQQQLNAQETTNCGAAAGKTTQTTTSSTTTTTQS